eukprot:TRINITY_DN74677_c0_g1_i1.p1 TRINITY_DN74677_c0_g1~~TRINITY_DN74677_c0_g1_i1.p1  ORF type:complete len:460 (+),score=117.71 TRINITY_DN74677_c0_g1_i1:66-1445(+)
MASDLDDIPALEDLSLYGLICRLELIEKLKATVAKPTPEEAAVLETESAAKKAFAQQLPALTSTGLTSKEKSKAKTFLELQVKTVDKTAAGADKRKAKFTELLAGVQEASAKDDPAHVTRAKAMLARTEKDFEEIHKSYHKWEKGKQMLSVDELKILKKNHETQKQRVEAATAFVETQYSRCPEAAAETPAILTATSRVAPAASVSRGAQQGGGGKGAVRGGGPAARVGGGGGGYGGGGSSGVSGGGGGGGSYPNANAVRQAMVAAQVRDELVAETAFVESVPKPPPPQRQLQQRVREVTEDSGPILSYACTCSAVAEHLGLTEKQVRDLGSSSSEFRERFDPETWERIKERSLAIEKHQREVQREKEKQKKDAALARATEKLVPTIPVPAPGTGSSRAVPPGAKASVVAGPPVAKTKAKAKPKVSSKTKPVDKLATGNRFGDFGESSDEDDGWTSVKR